MARTKKTTTAAPQDANDFGTRFSRRQALRAGALAGVGVTVGPLFRASSASAQDSGDASLDPFGRFGDDFGRAQITVTPTYGRMFSRLAPFAENSPATQAAMLELGKPGGRMDPGDDPTDTIGTANPKNADNPNMTAGMTFLGQFLDHDIAHDATSRLGISIDPTTVPDVRTPALDLDSLYAGGPTSSPHLFSHGGIKFLTFTGAMAPRGDLPRNDEGVALIGDPRNDENLVISQLHLAMAKFHNAVVDWVMAANPGLSDNRDIFEEARRLVRWHYQWITLHQFLPLTIGQDVLDDILNHGRRFYQFTTPFMPVEFSVGAYRFGHSQVRPGYRANFTGNPGGTPFLAPVFDFGLPESDDPNDLRGGKRAPRRFVDWPTFFDTGSADPAVLKHNKLIDTKLSTRLFQLLPGIAINPNSLPQRTFLRHLTMGLPSGQAIARAMRVGPLSPADLDAVADLGLHTSTPLFYYVLREAELQQGGRQLGSVGGRIVGETFVGMLQGDRTAYLRASPQWRPTLPAATAGEFTMVDLLRFAGVLP